MAIYRIDGFEFEVSFRADGRVVSSIELLPRGAPCSAVGKEVLGGLVEGYLGHFPETFTEEYRGCQVLVDEPHVPDSPQDTSSTIGYVSGVLKQAAEEVGGRATTYDSPQGEESMPKTVQMFNALYDKDLTPEQGWQFMAILKMVRSSQGEFKRDNYVDEAAYAAFACKAAQDKANENG